MPVNICDKLSEASRIGDLDLVKHLLKNIKIDANDMDITIHAAAVIAASRNQLDVVKYLLDKGINDYRFIIGDACMRNCIDVVKYLIEDSGIPLDKLHIGSCLHFSLVRNHLYLFSYLADKFGVKNIYYKINIAINNKYWGIAKYLIELCGKTEQWCIDEKLKIYTNTLLPPHVVPILLNMGLDGKLIDIVAYDVIRRRNERNDNIKFILLCETDLCVDVIDVVCDYTEYTEY